MPRPAYVCDTFPPPSDDTGVQDRACAQARCRCDAGGAASAGGEMLHAVSASVGDLPIMAGYFFIHVHDI